MSPVFLLSLAPWWTMKKDGTMTKKNGTGQTYDPAELQFRIEQAAELLGLGAPVRGPFACWETAAGLGFAMELAVRLMGTRPANRQAAMKAIREHVGELAKITKKWKDDDDAGYTL